MTREDSRKSEVMADGVDISLKKLNGANFYTRGT
jgi:hypothetical protein